MSGGSRKQAENYLRRLQMARPPEFFESDITDLSQPFPYLSGQRTHHVCPSHGARSFPTVVPNRKWPGLPSLAGNQSVSPRSIPLIQLAAVLYSSPAVQEYDNDAKASINHRVLLPLGRPSGRAHHQRPSPKDLHQSPGQQTPRFE